MEPEEGEAAVIAAADDDAGNHHPVDDNNDDDDDDDRVVVEEEEQPLPASQWQAYNIPVDDDYEDDDEDEDECRVCRGPAEEGRPLYKPCKCSGSIGLVHQDCLQSWLKVQGSGRFGRCELCKTRFVFAPRYLEGAPQQLSVPAVFCGLAHRAAVRWLPLLCRAVFCAALWLLMVPVLTSYLYHAWMHKPAVILDRIWDWNLVTADLVSGAVVAAIIIISFLSLMSFGDFLRAEWQQQGLGGFAVAFDDQEDHPAAVEVVLAPEEEGFQQQQQQPAVRVGGVGVGPAVAIEEGEEEGEQWRRRRGRRRIVGGRLDRAGGLPPVQPAVNENNVDNAIWDNFLKLDLEKAEENSTQPLLQQHRSPPGTGSMDCELHGDSTNTNNIGNNNIDDEDHADAGSLSEDSWNAGDGDDDNTNEPLIDDDSTSNDNGGAGDDDPNIPREPVIRRANDGGGGNNNNNVIAGVDQGPLPEWPNADNNNDDAQEMDMNIAGDGDDDASEPPIDDDSIGEDNEAADDDDDDDLNMPREPVIPRADDGGGGNNNNNNAAGGVDQAPLPDWPNADNNNDDGQEMDINIALDEMLGVRGPIGAVVRNFLWLLAFNAAYMGFFVFSPRVLGAIIINVFYDKNFSINAVTMETSAMLANVTIENSNSAAQGVFAGNATSSPTTLTGIWQAIEAESERVNTTFRLKDMATVTIGYFTCAFGIVFFRFLWAMALKMRVLRIGRHTNDRAYAQHRHQLQGQHNEDELREAMGEMNRLVNGRVNVNDRINPADVGGDPGMSLSIYIGILLDATMAVVKVGVLLFLKMFLLPVILGICLDASTMSLFGSTLQDRILYAGQDLFAFLLLHWVAGITFMLLVTVSVLQLREVAHPDLLGQMIRPQEPQPDLLGNLMHESCATHTKRMILSLAIYAVLLTMHVYLPVQILLWMNNKNDSSSSILDSTSADGMLTNATFAMHNITESTDAVSSSSALFELKFWYLLMPQLQVPLELLFFHLCMLALLEKYKNSIGELQHHWLVLLCSFLGITKNMLPMSVDKFRLTAARAVFLKNHGKGKNKDLAVDPFWHNVAETKVVVNCESLLDSLPKYGGTSPSQLEQEWRLHALSMGLEFENGSCVHKGEINARGERVLWAATADIDYIRLPEVQAKEKKIEAARSPYQLRNTSSYRRSILLPTKIGRYRLSRDLIKDSLGDKIQIISIWEEVSGDPIPRPPEGWDDLGAGGADEQGRWAWGREKKSSIEGSVKARFPFFSANMSWSQRTAVATKLALLVLLSWLVTTVMLLIVLSTPLAIGRGLYYVFRIPDRWIHDPAAFVFGSFVFFPICRTIAKALVMKNQQLTPFQRFKAWVGRFTLPPIRKAITVLSATVIWFGLVPVILGGLYDVAFLRPAAWFVTNGSAGTKTECEQQFLNWITGSILLYFWSRLCIAGILTRRFWSFVIEGANDEVNQNDANAGNDQRDNPDAADRPQMMNKPAWQGSTGRVAQYWETHEAVWLDWEWDKVDPVVLLHDCALPVLTELVLTTAATATAVFAVTIMTWLFKEIQQGNPHEYLELAQATFVRIFMVLSCCLQAGRVWRDQVRSWFQAAHKVARDDRYLIGEVLMNYNGK